MEEEYVAVVVLGLAGPSKGRGSDVTACDPFCSACRRSARQARDPSAGGRCITAPACTGVRGRGNTG